MDASERLANGIAPAFPTISNNPTEQELAEMDRTFRRECRKAGISGDPLRWLWVVAVLVVAGLLYVLFPSSDGSGAPIFGSIVVIVLIGALVRAVEKFVPYPEVKPTGYLSDGTPYFASGPSLAVGLWMIGSVITGMFLGWSVPDIVNANVVNYFPTGDHSMIKVSRVIGVIFGGYLGYRGTVLWAGLLMLGVALTVVYTVGGWVLA